MGYSTDKMLPVESTSSGQSNLVSVEYTCIPTDRTYTINVTGKLTMFNSLLYGYRLG